MEKWEWEKCIDYLFVHLLAVAERIGQSAFYVAWKKRDTGASRLMQRYADHPCSTWRSVKLRRRQKTSSQPPPVSVFDDCRFNGML
jgi:hypothetical protein